MATTELVVPLVVKRRWNGKLKIISELRIETRNPSGDNISINRCILPDNHLVASTIFLKNEKTSPKTRGRNSQGNNQQTSPNGNGNHSNNNRISYATAIFLEAQDLEDKSNVSSRHWNRYMEKLKAKDRDYNEQEELYRERLESQRNTFKNINENLQKQIDDLTRKNMALTIVLPNEFNKWIADEITKSLIETGDISDKLYKEIEKMTKSMTGDRTQVEDPMDKVEEDIEIYDSEEIEGEYEDDDI